MITKTLAPTLMKIDEVCSPQSLTLEVAHYLLQGYSVSLKKSEEGFSINLDFKPFKGFSSSQLYSIDLPQPIKLTNTTTTYFLPENAILLNQQPPNFDEEEPVIHIAGNISQFTTSNSDAVWHNKFLRLVLPVKKSSPKMSNICGYNFNTDISSKNKQLIEVHINNEVLHFLKFNSGDKQYIVIDTVGESHLVAFQKLNHSILLGLAFLYGDLFMDEGFILSSTDKDFSQIENIQFSTYRGSLYTGYGIHTTNPYSILNMTGRTTQEIEERSKEATSWVNDIVELEFETFSKLCELFYNSEPISRAAIVTLQGNTLALELKGSAYSIALEAITGVIMEEKKEESPKPISKSDFKILKDGFLKILDYILPSFEENKTAREIFKIRIENLNSPTNTSKLQKAFKLLGHDLNDYELKAVNARNKFQHGHLPISESTDDAVFQQVYFICLVMHRLIYVLILKRIDYKGYIINYPQLHSNITRNDLNEKVFYKI